MPVVAITGASAGVGRATVRAFAAAGWDTGLIARDQAGLDAAVKEVEATGHTGLAVATDVADAGAVGKAAHRIETELGPIDVWVNCAMVSVFSPTAELRPEEVQRVTDVTYLGYVWGTLAALRYMRPRDRGTIVQVGSALAYRAIPLQAAYCGAKHAIRGFTDSLRCELMHDRSRVRVTMVQLPALNTPQFEVVRTRLPGHPRPVAPIYQPEVAADAIMWAALHAPRELSVGASTVAAITANKLFPGLLDRHLARTGYDAQQLDEPVEPGRPDNLFAPVGGDLGPHGRFDAKAKRSSLQLKLRAALAPSALAARLSAARR
jgi:NADP-dependent 3-hydroxy acid dehydrogenase YdfG